MRIRVLSNLHPEFGSVDLPDVAVDLVVLAEGFPLPLPRAWCEHPAWSQSSLLFARLLDFLLLAHALNPELRLPPAREIPRVHDGRHYHARAWHRDEHFDLQHHEQRAA
jgi:hypothetical protein